jgi:hypothetical protein
MPFWLVRISMEIDFIIHCHVVILLSKHHHHHQGVFNCSGEDIDDDDVNDDDKSIDNDDKDINNDDIDDDKYNVSDGDDHSDNDEDNNNDEDDDDNDNNNGCERHRLTFQAEQEQYLIQQESDLIDQLNQQKVQLSFFVFITYALLDEFMCFT